MDPRGKMGSLQVFEKDGGLRLAVSNILKKNHVVHIVYGLMFYCAGSTLVPFDGSRL
jgi:hypothetical protein